MCFPPRRLFNLIYLQILVKSALAFLYLNRLAGSGPRMVLGHRKYNYYFTTCQSGQGSETSNDLYFMRPRMSYLLQNASCLFVKRRWLFKLRYPPWLFAHDRLWHRCWSYSSATAQYSDWHPWLQADNARFGGLQNGWGCWQQGGAEYSKKPRI